MRLYIVGLLLLFSNKALSQTANIGVSGQIFNSVSREPISFPSVLVLPADTLEEMSKNIGFVADENGEFNEFFNYKFPLRLRVNHISYRQKDIIVRNYTESKNLRIYLDPEVYNTDELVVTAAIISNEELESTESILKISVVDVQQLASFDVFDLVSTVREVDIATQSMTMQSVNTRGFNSSANKRFLQLTDGIDNRAPGLNFPIGNLMGLIDLDISSVEIFPGPLSAKYGSSALNGVMIMKSRDLFVDQGFSMQIKTGANRLDVGTSSIFATEGVGLFDVQARYATSFNDKFGFKITGSLMAAEDWYANNFDNIGYGNRNDSHPEQPGYNGINVYGDDTYSFEALYTGEDGFLYPGPPVSRTGYKEQDLVDYSISSGKLAGELKHKFSDDYWISLKGRYGLTDALFTGDSRVRLENFTMYQTSLDIQLSKLKFLGYVTWQESNDSYNVNRLAEQLVQTSKPDADWYRDYKIAFTQGIPFLGVPPNNHRFARNFADSRNTLLVGKDFPGRLIPGSDLFKSYSNEIIYNRNPNVGAAFLDNSKSYSANIEYELPASTEIFGFKLGSSFRFYDVESEGTIFPDTAGNDITNYEYGVYFTNSSKLLDENLNLDIGIRLDKNENFDVKLSPSIAVNYNLNDSHYFKLSYQYGFRYPDVREQFVDNNLGNRKVLGGLSQNVDRYNFQNNSFYQSAVDEYLENLEGNNTIQNRYENLQILREGIVGNDKLRGIQPEQVNTFEIGYRRLFTPTLFLELNSYVSFYKNFIGITRVIKPATSPSVDLLNAAAQVAFGPEHEQFYVFSNSEGQLIVVGSSFNLEYNSGNFNSSLNGTYANLLKSSDDPITPGFNTPPLKINFEWGNRELIRNLGFKFVFRFRTTYNWESPFLDGPIETYGHLDAQFNSRLPKINSMLKFGVTNFGVNEYYNVFGGPSIGSILFATLSYNPKLY